MNNVALILAGGSGSRFGADIPKQFVVADDKPVIIHTIEHFYYHNDIDKIVVTCAKDWILYLTDYLQMHKLYDKVVVIEGGNTGQQSIYFGIKYISDNFGLDLTVLIHDGVRPLITKETITDNIKAVNEYGSCITCSPVTETIVIQGKDELTTTDRSRTFFARAPQSFRVRDILECHQRANLEKKATFIDSFSMMNYYGKQCHLINGPEDNIKITTVKDLHVVCNILRDKSIKSK